MIPISLPTANCVDIIISRPGPLVRPDFLATWINSDFGKGQVLRVQGGLAQQHFNVGDMKKLIVVVPSLAEQARVAALLNASSERLRSERESTEKLRALKRGLMDDLLTGRVRVTVPESDAA